MFGRFRLYFKGDLAEEMQVADTTITKDLKRLREMLKDFQLSISGTPNRGLKLNGHESRIRLVLIHHVMDYLPDDFRLNQAVQSAIDQYALSKNIEKRVMIY
jgi:lichenan operon transcriptional antiterminator